MKIATLYKLYTKFFFIDIDTRNIRQNTLFFALKGANFNGNEFAEKAIKLGAYYAVVDEEKYKTHENIILVDDVLKTLQQLAHHHRKKLNIPIIGLTGSNGKTTTKELIQLILSKKYNVDRLVTLKSVSANNRQFLEKNNLKDSEEKRKMS